MLCGRILTAFLQGILDTLREVTNAVLNITDHSLVILLLGSDLEAFFFEPLRCVYIIHQGQCQ
jgi:hypothetical protein